MAHHMSFRARLTLFFVLVVIVPMVSLTFVLFRLIDDNQRGKADARLGGRLEGAGNLYEAARGGADRAAVLIGRDVRLATALRAGDRAAADARATTLLPARGALRIIVRRDGRILAQAGDPSAIFPAERRLVDRGGAEYGTLEVATQDPRAFAENVARRDGELEVVLRRGRELLASTLSGPVPAGLPTELGDVTAGGREFRGASFATPDFGRQTVQVSLLEDTAATRRDTREAQLIGGALLAGFFGLAFVFALLVSRSLQRQIGGFLEAARRLGRGDFTAQVPTYGNDEFAALGQEFNLMSGQLERRLEELRAEQGRLNTAMRRIGETFASNLDRNALLEIVLRTALDGTAAEGGRAAMRDDSGRSTSIRVRVGDAQALETVLAAAESESLRGGYPGEANVDGCFALAHPLWSGPAGDDDGPPRVTGAVSVGRRGARFTEPERELFHYLAGQASVSLENVGLHETVERQAVTDDLTGLANRRAFDETITTEVERSRRFDQPVALVMVDIDDFKRVNDRFGHLLGDEVLKQVADVLRASGREIDESARYGGEELAMVLPGTDLQGAYNLAERIRQGIADLRIPLPDGEVLEVTASLGAAVRPGSADDVVGLVRAADQALYEAKRSGKNRTARAAEVPSA
jgi:diguanylate cyclase (GGDEF)-like protein